jgi:hypothetical protein
MSKGRKCVDEDTRPQEKVGNYCKQLPLTIMKHASDVTSWYIYLHGI